MSARLRTIGRDLQSKLKEFFETSLGPDATPLELLQAALDDLEARIQPAGRGRRVFPYDRVVVRIARTAADAPAIEAVFRDLPARLRARLSELQCEAPALIDASVSVTDPAGDTTAPVLSVECFAEKTEAPAPAAQDVRCPAVAIAVVKGQCGESQYLFEEAPVIAIGRTPEPTDALGQVRYNHVAFLEVRDGVNETVGRAHARLQLDPESGHYHLFNEGSSNPTAIIRGGRRIVVAPRDPRGVRVQSGDQVQLGRAMLKVTLESR